MTIRDQAGDGAAGTPTATEYRPAPAERPGDAHPAAALVLIRCVGGCGLLLAAAIKSKSLAYLLLPLFLL